MKNETSPVRVVLLIVGLVIAGLIPLLVFPLIGFFFKTAFTFSVAFMLLFLVFVLPAVFRYRRKDADKLLIGGAIYYRRAIIFAIITIAALILLALKILTTGAAIAIILAAAFIFALSVYIAYSAGKHIQNVAEEEREKLQPVTDLRARASAAALSLEKTFPGNTELQQKSRELAENLRYLSPSDQPEAARLEMKIAQQFTNLEAYIAANVNGSEAEINQCLDDISFLYRQRKSIY